MSFNNLFLFGFVFCLVVSLGCVCADGSYSDFESLVNGVSDGDTIVLDQDYSYGDGDPSSIVIGKSVSIDGNGYSLNGNKGNVSFVVSGDGVCVSNLTFRNHCTNTSLITWNGNNGRIINSNFVENNVNIHVDDENNVSLEGGIIYCKGNDFTILDSIFDNNLVNISTGILSNVSLKGGVIYYIGNKFSIINSTFNRNNIMSYSDSNSSIFIQGGNIYSNLKNGSIINSIFRNALVRIDINNFTSSTIDGGIIYWSGNVSIYGSDFDFNSIVLYHVYNLDFYNRSNYYDSKGSGGVIFLTNNYFYDTDLEMDVSSSFIVDSNFYNNVFNGAKLSGDGIISCYCVNIINSSFARNYAGFGGAISGWLNVIINSSFVSNSVGNRGGAIYGGGIIINSTFVANSAPVEGGALSGDFDIYNSSFVDNSALSGYWYSMQGKGGAISGWGVIVNSSFVNNRAGAIGGAILGGFDIYNSSFVSNSAGDKGGAISNDVTWGFVLSFSSCRIVNSSFINNSAKNGGAIYGSGLSVNNSCFINNTATIMGGAIQIIPQGIYLNPFGDIIIVNSSFVNNHAGSGGAICYGDDDHGNGNGKGFIVNSSFVNNSAEYGGAIYTIGQYEYGPSLLVFNSSFICNNASFGGAAYLNSPNRYIEGDGEWNGNDYVYTGIYYTNGSLLFNSSFVNNSASFGGAVYVMGDAEILNCTFTNNFVNESGGAIYCTDGDSSIINCTFIFNFAVINGGAIYWNFNERGTVYSDLVEIYNDYFEPGDVLSNSVFIFNSAEYGGALYCLGGGFINVSSFICNNASFGGAIYWNFNKRDGVWIDDLGEEYYGDGDVVFNSSFVNNSAEYGGALYCLGGGSVNVSSFVNNSANWGGAVYWDKRHLVFDEYYDSDVGEWVEGWFVPEGNYVNDSVIFESSFVNNSANWGGALYSIEGFSDILFSNFTCNFAYNGSAIYLENGSLSVNKTIFMDNLAKSYYLPISISDDGGVYTVTLIGGDNILHAIYNGGNVNNVLIDGVVPVNGAENSNNGTLLYQDSREANETINILVYTAGVLLLNTTGVTDIFGSVSFTPVNWDNLSFIHYESLLYTYIENSTIIGVGLSYVDLADLIYSTLGNGSHVLYLNSSYSFDWSRDLDLINTGVFINESLSIYGNGFTLNGKGLGKLFTIYGGNVFLFDCNIVNHNSTNGGAILWLGDKGRVYNCNFTNNYGFKGGAIFWNGSNGILRNVRFVNNTGGFGSGVYHSKGDLALHKVIFENNSVMVNSLSLSSSDGVFYASLSGGDNFLGGVYRDYVNGVLGLPVSVLVYSGGVLVENITKLTDSDGVVSFTPSSGDTLVFVYNSEDGGVISNSTSISSGDSPVSYSVLNSLSSVLSDVDVLFDEESFVLGNVNPVISTSVSVSLEVGDLVMVCGDGSCFTGKLVDASTGKSIVGHHVSVCLTRLSSGASKVYDVVSDYNGVFSLPINLASGEYGVKCSFEGVSVNGVKYTGVESSSSIKVLSESSNDGLSTYFDVDDLVMVCGDGSCFTGSLLSSEGVVVGHHVSVCLTRLSSGASKVYDVVSDFSGVFSLPINLASGEYSVLCSYSGVLGYSSCVKSSKITILEV